MMQQLRANTERVNATASRVADFASGVLDSAAATLGSVFTGTAATNGLSTVFAGTACTNAGFANNPWNGMPQVHTTAICTHGKRYERRLQEMLT